MVAAVSGPWLSSEEMNGGARLGDVQVIASVI